MILDARKVITANILVKIAFAKNVKTATTITGKSTRYTGLGISFQTLEMNCLRWTGSSQIFFEETQNEKKYHPNIIWKF